LQLHKLYYYFTAKITTQIILHKSNYVLKQ
jgi:hypothetical protein